LQFQTGVVETGLGTRRLQSSNNQKSAASPLEVARRGSRPQLYRLRGPILHPRTNFQRIRTTCDWVIDDSTNFLGPFQRPRSDNGSQRKLDRTIDLTNLGKT